jgi:hypothetical protein
MIDPEQDSAGGDYAAEGPRRLSTVFEELAREADRPVGIARVRDALGDRSLAALLAFFAAVNLLPLPPGTTIVLGPPLVIVAVQMMLGYSKVWLPRSVLERSIEAERFRQLTKGMMPRLLRLERLIRPRYWPFPGQRSADRTIGAVALLFAIAVTLPIPFGNWLPALSIFLIALALSERDGVLLGAGLIVGALAFVVIALVAGTAHAAFVALFG